MAERRQGQRGFARRRGQPRPPPGAGQVDIRQTPDFQAWVSQWGQANISTVPEYLCFRWLERQGLKPNIDFFYLDYKAGIGRVGQQQVDFNIGDWLVWMVQGQYFHWVVDPEQRVRDAISRAILESKNYVVVELLDLDILAHTESTCRKALVGIEEPGVQEGRQS